VPFEFVADYNYTRAGLAPDDVRWGKIATALTKRILTAEPKACIVLRSLPPPGQPKHLVLRIQPETAKTLPEPLRSHCEIPEGRWELIHQYFCRSPSCMRDGKAKWFPKMYLGLHKGHEIEKSAPTGRSQKFPWKPNFRLFFGSAARLSGSIPVMASGCVTGEISDDVNLSKFDWIFTTAEAKTNLRTLTADTAAGTLLTWMREEDKKLVAVDEPAEQIEVADGEASAEALRKRIIFASQMISVRAQAKVQQSKIE
jgi:hypothetical protein